jgi:hypothetical protein
MCELSMYTHVYTFGSIYIMTKDVQADTRGGGHLGRAEHFEDVVGEKCRHCRTVLVNALQDLHQHLMRGRLIDRLKQPKFFCLYKEQFCCVWPVF